MTKKGFLITFSGTDGAGKSTQISILKNKIKSKGQRCFILWARGGYTYNFEFLKKLIRFFFNKHIPPSGKNKERTSAMANPLVSRIWLNLAILDLCFYWIIILRYKLFQGYYVICDRFIEDTTLDFKNNFPEINFEKMFLWRLLAFLRCKPDLSFLLYVSAEKSIIRSKIKNEPFPDDLNTLKWRLKSYLSEECFKKSNFIIINTERSLNETSLIIERSFASTK